MSRHRGTRVGLASRLKLEVCTRTMERLPIPLAASVGRCAVTGHVQVCVAHDPDSRYCWGNYDSQYDYWPLEIPNYALTYDTPEDADVVFTFTKPSSEHWRADGSLVITLPDKLRPPRAKQKPARRTTTPVRQLAATPVPVESPPTQSVAQSLPLPDYVAAVSTADLVRALNERVRAGKFSLRLRLEGGELRASETIT